MWSAFDRAIAIASSTLTDIELTLGLTSADGSLAGVLVLALLGLLGVGLVWALVLALARAAVGRSPAGRDLSSWEPAVDWGPRAAEPADADDREEPSFGRGRLRLGDEAPAPLAGAAGALSLTEQELSLDAPQAEDQAMPVHHVRLARLPRPEPLGAVKSARPEWTGAVVPTSLEDAGAVEVARVSMRHEPTAKAKGRNSVRAVDYRISALPRVDAGGLRRPNMLVYTALDRGFVPKAKGLFLRRRS
jgi:hypothetical protein